MERLFESIRLRSQVPLESLCSLLVLAKWLIPAGTSPPPPFKLCGFVYAKPNTRTYIISSSICVMLIIFKTISIFYRCLLHRKGNFAVLRPTVLIGNGLAAIYSTKWIGSFPSFLFIFFSIILGIPLGIEIPSVFPIFVGFICVQLLNVWFAFNKDHLSRKNGTKKFKFAMFLTVLNSDREYRNLDLESKDWNPIEIEDTTEIPCEAHKNPSHHVVIDVDESEDALVVFGTGEFAYSSKPTSVLWKEPNKYYRIVRDERFCLVKVNVPYVLVWYSVYGFILDNGGFVGAEEIDKCLIWLVLVTMISEILVRTFPGPALVVEAEK